MSFSNIKKNLNYSKLLICSVSYVNFSTLFLVGSVRMRTMQKLLIFSAMITKAWTAAGLAEDGVDMNTGMRFISMGITGNSPTSWWLWTLASCARTDNSWVDKQRGTFPPARAERKLGMEWGLKPDGGEWPDTQTRVSEDELSWVGAGKAVSVSVAGWAWFNQQAGLAHPLHPCHSRVNRMWHMAPACQCEALPVRDSSHAVRAVYWDSCAGLHSQMETPSLQRVTLSKSLFIREHTEENSHMLKHMGHSRDLMFCGKCSVKITT